MRKNNQLGALGEARAAQYLQKKGYTILARNFYYRKGELDLVALKDDTLVVVEVKTRNSSYFGDPQRFVTQKKIRLMVRAADAYMQQNNLEYAVRFDIMALLLNNKQEQITHIKDAFYHF